MNKKGSTPGDPTEGETVALLEMILFFLPFLIPLSLLFYVFKKKEDIMNVNDSAPHCSLAC